MARPLELSFDSRGRIAVGTAGAVLVILLLSLTGSYGWPAVAAVVALLWAGFLVTVWLRSRAFLMVDGSKLTVRRYRGLHTVDGSQVQRVTEYYARRTVPQADRARRGWEWHADTRCRPPCCAPATPRSSAGCCGMHRRRSWTRVPKDARAASHTWTGRVRAGLGIPIPGFAVAWR